MKYDIKEGYLLMPYGSLTTSNHRFVAEMILNEDGETLPGFAMFPGDNIDPALAGAQGKMVRTSSGIYLTDIYFLTTVELGGKVVMHKQGEIIKRSLEEGMTPKPLFSGNVNKKLRIVMDCRVHGFYIGPSQNLKASPRG